MIYTEKPKISVIIINYNYGLFLEESIESVLAQTYPLKEVIVVDDGSTDESRIILRKYEKTVQSILKENEGQIVAADTGFRKSTGDLVLFLDSDDYLLPDCLTEISNTEYHDIVKIHFLMEKRDENGKFMGYHPGSKKLDSGRVLEKYLKKSFYSTTVTSGNVFTRPFLQRVMPLPNYEKTAVDGYLNTYAALHGPIKKIEKPLVVYRQHKLSDRSRADFDMNRIKTYVFHEINRYRILRDTVPCLTNVFLFKYSARIFHFIAFKLYCSDIELPEIKMPVWKLIVLGMKALICYDEYPLRYKTGTFMWFCAFLFPSKKWKKMVVKWKYSVSQRPKPVGKILKLLNTVFFKKGRI
ncbi:MAG: glycosyltransferase family 2 protein [Thermotogota bacterium]